MAQMELFFTKNLLIFIDRCYWGDLGVIVIVADFAPRCMFWGVESNPEHKILQKQGMKLPCVLPRDLGCNFLGCPFLGPTCESVGSGYTLW